MRELKLEDKSYHEKSYFLPFPHSLTQIKIIYLPAAGSQRF
jgi:hypothetical protein